MSDLSKSSLDAYESANCWGEKMSVFEVDILSLAKKRFVNSKVT